MRMMSQFILLFITTDTDRITNLLFPAFPLSCDVCEFNHIEDRAECSRCTMGFGVTNDTKTCAGDSVKALFTSYMFVT